jgi:N-acetylmuramoyl-L-alanine amidase
MKHYTYKNLAFLAVILLGVPWLINSYPQSMKFIDQVFYYVNNNFATVILHNAITVKDLNNKYDAVIKGEPKVRILISPGHEPNYGGTEYRDLKERELNVELAGYLKDFLKGNDHYEVIVSRDNKAWNTDLQKYFDEHWEDIKTFIKQSQSEMIHSVNTGKVTKLF